MVWSNIVVEKGKTSAEPDVSVCGLSWPLLGGPGQHAKKRKKQNKDSLRVVFFRVLGV